MAMKHCAMCRLRNIAVILELYYIWVRLDQEPNEGLQLVWR